MACNCLETEPILTRLREQKPGVNITGGDFLQTGLVFGKKTSHLTFTEFEYSSTFEKKDKSLGKKNKIINLIHKYCPFCGVEYNPEEIEAVDADKAIADGH